MELNALHATGRRREGVLRDFVERMCTDYSAMMCTHTTSYRNRLSTVLADALLRFEYGGGYCIQVGADSYSLRIHEEITENLRGDGFSQSYGDDDIIEAVVLSSNPSSSPPQYPLFSFLSHYFYHSF